MNVAELARDLGVPASTIIQQCQRFGIDASWAGAQLSSSDVVVLRAELAQDDGLLDLTGHGEAGPATTVGGDGSEVAAVATEPEPEPEPEPAGTADAPSLPPTAVGSLPELADELAEEEAEPAPAPTRGALQTGPRPPAPGAANVPLPSGPGSRTGGSPARLDRGIGRSATWLGLAGVAVLVAIVSANAWVVAPLWFVAVVLVLLALLDANRARARVALHPERVRGRAQGRVLLGVGLVGLVVLGAAAWVVVRSEDADGAPGLGSLAAVQNARWGYQRVQLVKDDGWRSPAKQVGSCWRIDEAADPRREGRTEVGNDKVDCDGQHDVEVIHAWSSNRDADAPFPGVAALEAEGREECTEHLAAANRATGGEPSAEAELFVERPGAAAWADGDHDLTCAAVTPSRAGALPAG